MLCGGSAIATATEIAIANLRAPILLTSQLVSLAYRRRTRPWGCWTKVQLFSDSHAAYDRTTAKESDEQRHDVGAPQGSMAWVSIESPIARQCAPSNPCPIFISRSRQ